MQFFNKLFGKKPETQAAQTACEISDLKQSIESFRLESDRQMQLLLQALRKTEMGQKEAVLQLDELSSQLLDDSGEQALAAALISVIDAIEDFYRLTPEASAMFAQAQMMWHVAMKAAAAGGLEVINPKNQPPDFKRHKIESTTNDPAAPNGYVVNTLKCGYIYKNELLRPAAVLVNKKEDI